MTADPAVPQALAPLLDRVRAAAEGAGVFDGAEVRDGVLICKAKDAAAPASYRVQADRGSVYVSLVMADRWQSGSIELDLIHTGDKLEALIDEELVNLGLPSDPRPVEHFRSEDLLFTFRTAVLSAQDVQFPRAAEIVAAWLLAYEAAFRELGDMSGGDEE